MGFSTEIRLIDLRYLKKNDHYSFVAIAHVQNDNVIYYFILAGYLIRRTKVTKGS